MARSDILTWLPLDDFAAIFGWDPLAFNGMSSATLRTNTRCGDPTFQFDWQHSERIGRDSIALAILEAEREIAQEVGYNLIPDWTFEERMGFPRPADPGAYNLYGVNPRWQGKSVEAPRGHVITGGVKAKSVIQAGAAVVRSDADGDTYNELCTVTVATSITDANEIRAYYPSKSGDDGWEIRPIKVAFSGGNAIITFKSWQIAAANQMERMDQAPVDADNASSYETTVDIYRVYNDPSSQVQFVWENSPVACCGNTDSCVACQLSTQSGCFHLRDSRMGFIVPSPGSWNASDQQFDAAYWTACREPDQLVLNYYSGLRAKNLARPFVEMDPYWKSSVAYYAASKLDRDVCGCSNVAGQIGKWRRDMAYAQSSATGGASFTETAEIMGNRFGTTAGAIYAYKRVQQNGVKINK